LTVSLQVITCLHSCASYSVRRYTISAVAAHVQKNLRISQQSAALLLSFLVVGSHSEIYSDDRIS